MDTLALCLKLRDAHYQPDAANDPEVWNNLIESWPNFNDGYRWEKHPVYGWYPNPGRKALMDEIRKLIGHDAFDAKYGVGENVHQSLSHEAWMAEWLQHKDELDAKVATSTTTNDKPDTVAPGAGSSEESASTEV